MQCSTALINLGGLAWGLAKGDAPQICIELKFVVPGMGATGFLLEALVLRPATKSDINHWIMTLSCSSPFSSSSFSFCPAVLVRHPLPSKTHEKGTDAKVAWGPEHCGRVLKQEATPVLLPFTSPLLTWPVSVLPFPAHTASHPLSWDVPPFVKAEETQLL